MLQIMRDLAHTRVVKGLMILLVVSFGIWGIGDIFRGNALQRTVAKAGDVSISVQSLNREFEQMLSRARQIIGPDFTAQQARQQGLLDKALEGMIERAEADQDLVRLGIEASPKSVLDMLAAQPQFRDKNGAFNKEAFRRIVEQSRLSEKDFLAQGQKEIARQQLLGIFHRGGKAPRALVDALYKARGQKRIVTVVTVKNATIANIPAPDEKTLHSFYEAHPDDFTAPEYRGITIARLSADDVAKDITISDEKVRQEYDTNGSQYAQPERRDLVQAVVQDETRAKQLATAAKASGSLAAATKAAGVNAVALDQSDEKSLPPELAKPVFALKAGQISEPIKSSLGWHVVQVKRITPGGRPEFKAVKQQIRETMQHDQAIETVTRLTNQLDDQLAAGHALEDIADGLRLRLVKIPAIDAGGKVPDGKDPPEFPGKDHVLKPAFGQNAGETSPVLDDRNGNYFVVRTDEVTPSTVRPFDTIKEKIAAAWKAEEQAKRAAAEAERIAKMMRDGKPVKSAALNGAEMRESKPVSLLGDNDPALPASVMPQIFALKRGETVTAEIPGGQLVLRFDETVDADTGSAAEGRKGKIASDLAVEEPNELTEEYLKYLRIIFPVKIRRDVLETVATQGG